MSPSSQIILIYLDFIFIIEVASNLNQMNIYTIKYEKIIEGAE